MHTRMSTMHWPTWIDDGRGSCAAAWQRPRPWRARRPRRWQVEGGSYRMCLMTLRLGDINSDTSAPELAPLHGTTPRNVANNFVKSHVMETLI